MSVPTDGRFKKTDNTAVNIADKLDPTPLEGSSTMIPVTSAAAVPLGANINPQVIGGIVVPEVDIRYWIDGTSPTTTEGFFCPAFGQIHLESLAECQGFKAIAVSTSGSMARCFYKNSEV
jgi:hypothetical protein